MHDVCHIALRAAQGNRPLNEVVDRDLEHIGIGALVNHRLGDAVDQLAGGALVVELHLATIGVADNVC